MERDKDYGRLQSQYNISPVGLVDIRHFVKELDPNYPDCGRETRYGLQGGFQLLDLIITELKSHMTR